MSPNNDYSNDPEISKPDSGDMIEKESMPDMLDVIWEADDLGIQGGFMYYYPEETDK